jgi:hypothetical protein
MLRLITQALVSRASRKTNMRVLPVRLTRVTLVPPLPPHPLSAPESHANAQTLEPPPSTDAEDPTSFRRSAYKVAYGAIAFVLFFAAFGIWCACSRVGSSIFTMMHPAYHPAYHPACGKFIVCYLFSERVTVKHLSPPSTHRMVSRPWPFSILRLGSARWWRHHLSIDLAYASRWWQRRHNTCCGLPCHSCHTVRRFSSCRACVGWPLPCYGTHKANGCRPCRETRASNMPGA